MIEKQADLQEQKWCFCSCRFFKKVLDYGKMICYNLLYLP